MGFRRYLDIGQRYLNRAAFGHRVSRSAHDYLDGLRNLFGIRRGRIKVRSDRIRASRLGAPRRALGSLMNDAGQVCDA